MSNQWGADVPISMPEPLPPHLDSVVPMDGFTMTHLGLFPDLSAADHERLSRPSFAPYDPTRTIETVPEDDEEEETWPNARA